MQGKNEKKHIKLKRLIKRGQSVGNYISMVEEKLVIKFPGREEDMKTLSKDIKAANIQSKNNRCA